MTHVDVSEHHHPTLMHDGHVVYDETEHAAPKLYVLQESDEHAYTVKPIAL